MFKEVEHTHLNNLLKTVLESSPKISDYVDILITELSLTTLICPSVRGDIQLFYSGDYVYVPAFTDMREFIKYRDDCAPMFWDFPQCHEYFDSEVTGVMINPETLTFVIDKDLMFAVVERYLQYNDFSHLNSDFTTIELNRLRKSYNFELENQIENDADFINLYDEMSKSTLFTLMNCEKNVDKYAEDGIISREHMQLDDYVIVANCAVVFTSFNHINPVYHSLKKEKINTYPHITNLEMISKFVIENDLDALIINKDHNNFIIPRFHLAKNMEYIIELCRENVKNDYSDFVYLKEYLPEYKGNRIRVTLDDAVPASWKELILPKGLTFNDFDNILKKSWDLNEDTFSRFTFDKSFDIILSNSDSADFERGEIDSQDVSIDTYLKNNDKIFWEYGYDREWSCTIEVENTVGFEQTYPLIVRYKGKYNLKEGIGGVEGLKNLITDSPDELTQFNPFTLQEYLNNFKTEPK